MKIAYTYIHRELSLIRPQTTKVHHLENFKQNKLDSERQIHFSLVYELNIRKLQYESIKKTISEEKGTSWMEKWGI